MFCVEEHKWDYFTRIYTYIYRCAGDASSPGGDALSAGEDTFLTRAYVRVHNIYLETFFVPCFIFITQCIDNQYFQEIKH